MKLVYTALAKEIHFTKDYIMRHVIDLGHAPINPFNHSYWLLDTVERDKIREVGNFYVTRCDELWVFNDSPIITSDGVIREIKIAEKLKKTIKFFIIDKETQKITEMKDMIYQEEIDDE